MRWFPAPEDQRKTAYEKLLPPLVANIRDGVMAWRNSGYANTSATSRALLTWWFGTDHLTEQADGTKTLFRYYYAQREAVETVIWLYDPGESVTNLTCCASTHPVQCQATCLTKTGRVSW